MLKLNYTDDGLYMEQAALSVEAFVNQRVILALRMGRSLHVEPSTASFVLLIQSADIPTLNKLAQEAAPHPTIKLTAMADPCVEITLSGTWIAATPSTDEGTFVTILGDPLERHIIDLWQRTMPGSPDTNYSPNWGMATNS